MTPQKKKPNRGWIKRKQALRQKIVDHHITYTYNGNTHKQEEIVVPVYYMEHHIITQLQRRGKYISKGFIKTLKYFIWEHEECATDLSTSCDKTIENIEGQNEE